MPATRPAPTTLPPAADPTRTTEIAAPPAPPHAIASQTVRKADIHATQIVAPLPPPVPPLAKGMPGRSSSPRVISELAAGESSLGESSPGGSSPGEPSLKQAAGAEAPAVPPASADAGRRPETDRAARIRVVAIGGATLVAVALVVAIGFSSEGVPGAPAAAELLLAPEPRPSASPAPETTAAPATSPAAPVQRAPVPASVDDDAARAQPPTQPPAPPPEEPRSAAAPAPRRRPRAPTPSPRASATRESGHAKPASHPHARAARPLNYDPDALFLDKR